MLKNSLVVSLRMLMRNKVYALINVTGLSLGIGACLMIWLISHHELSFDRFHPDVERIFRVITFEQYTSETPLKIVPAVVPPLPAALRSQIAGIEVCAAYHLLGDVKVDVPGAKSAKQFSTQGAILSSSDYFRVMQYEWLAGNAITALSQPNTIVLTENKATLYFGILPPNSFIGKELIYDDSIHVSVTGIVRDWKGNTDFQYSEFISFATADHGSLRTTLQLDQWKGTPVSSRVLLKLQEKVSQTTVQTALASIFNARWKNQMMVRTELQPLSQVHFTDSGAPGGNSVSRMSTLVALLAIALFILILAVVNYINLSTAQSISRAKEISVRKIMGSSKAAIVIQFLSETFTLSVIAVVIACACITPVLSVFRQFIPAGVQFDLLNGSTYLFLAGIIIVTTLLAGLYPAWSLSDFKMTRASRPSANFQGRTASKLRKAMVVFQFSISLVFIISAILIGRQIQFMLKSNPGFSSEAVIQISTNDRAHMNRVKLLQSRINNLSGVVTTARENIPPMGIDRAYTGLEFPKMSADPIQVAAIKADENFVPLYNIRIVAGRNLLPSDTLQEILINESLSTQLGFGTSDDAIGQQVKVWGKKIPIAGVVGDFHQADFHQAIAPQIIMGIECADIAVKLNSNGQSGDEVKNTLSRIENEWKKIYPQEPFEYSFLDEELANLYKQEEITSWLVNIATGITVFISCIGLFGLTLYSIEQRIREIGIRKVLGASTPEIVSLFLKEFLILIAVALIIASPAAWFVMHHWLQSFAYRVPISLWIFLSGGAIAAGIAAVTVSCLSFNAANSNPVSNLKTD